jgi:hypothetical protein
MATTAEAQAVAADFLRFYLQGGAAAARASGDRYTYAYDRLGNLIQASSTLHAVEQRYEQKTGTY